uniref:Integrase zinc-binding domain-containing protein n=1 Tax=Lygus hesperus TaxID=30085 RepID=A0A0A9XNT8_LYGHE
MTRYIFKTSTFEIYYLTYRTEEILDNTRQEQIIKECHGSLLSGHESMNRKLKKIQMYYKWPLMKDQVENFVKNCTECQTNKDTRKKTKEPMQITTTAFETFQKVNVDLMGPFPISIQGNKYILTVQCDLTKYSIAVPIPNQESFTIAEALVKEAICIYGCPRYIGRN